MFSKSNCVCIISLGLYMWRLWDNCLYHVTGVCFICDLMMKSEPTARVVYKLCLCEYE